MDILVCVYGIDNGLSMANGEGLGVRELWGEGGNPPFGTTSSASHVFPGFQAGHRQSRLSMPTIVFGCGNKT